MLLSPHPDNGPGDGEWKVRQHGTSKRRTWRKVHLAVDQATGLIRAAAITTNSISDGEMLPTLLEQVPQTVCQVSADGGYDRRTCYDAITRRGARAVIPPRCGARIWQHGNSKQERLARDENLRRIRQVGRTKSGGPHQVEARKRLPPPQSSGTSDVPPQDALRQRTAGQRRGCPRNGNTAALGRAQQNDGTGIATKLCHLIYATTPTRAISCFTDYLF